MPTVKPIEWEAPEGIRRVIGQHGSGAFLVQTDGMRFPDLVHDVDSERALDARRLESQRKIRAAKDQTDRQAADELAAFRDIDGFAADASPMLRAKIVAALNRTLRSNGEYMSRKAFVRANVAAGAEVCTASEGRRLTMPNGVFFAEADMSKTAMDYAAHLIALRPEPC